MNRGEKMMTVPAVGDEIYVPSALYLSHGEDDVLGGLATVSSVQSERHGNRTVHKVTVKELPSRGYYWENGLAEEQEELKQRFGNGRARPDPDTSPEFNSGSVVTQEHIRVWLDEGRAQKATHVIVISDSYDRVYYPVYVMIGEDPHKIAEKESAGGDLTVKEVYSLSRDIDAQLAESRALHYD